MRRIGAAEWQAELGELRQGTEPVVIMYRRRPTAVLVPIPPSYWSNASTSLDQMMQLRDQYLQPPMRQNKHAWVQEHYSPHRVSTAEARRGPAMIFGFLMHNEPVILTFYGYDAVTMIPLPSDTSDQHIARLVEEMQESIQAPD